MAYIDDLNAPQRRRPRVIGAPGASAADPVNVSYAGPSPIDPDGNPNPGYTGNTGIRPPRVPPVPVPPPPPPPPNGGGQQGAGGGGGAATPPQPPPPAPPPQTSNLAQTTYAAALDELYKKYFYRAPNAGELQAHIGNLMANQGTLANIEAELQREAARLQLKPPSQTSSQAPIPPPRTAQNNPGLDPAKWLSGHTSPKYAFMDVSRQYDQRTPEGRAQTLAELQRLYPQWFTGWTIAGDKLRYGGDLSSLNGEWNGYNEFDAWRGSKVGEWAPQWIPTQLNGQAYIDPASQATAPATTGAGGGAPGSGVPGSTGAAGPGGAPGTAGAGGGGTATAPLPGLGGADGLNFGVTGEYGYDDPNTRQLEEFLRLLIDEKVKPIEDPARDAYAQQMWDAINQLTNPALTENDRSRLENRALEPMERDRQIRLQQAKERMAAMGHGESSGTIADALSMVDRDFDQRRGEVQRDISIYDREQQDARRRESLSLGEALASLSGQQRGEQDARMREALTYLSLFPEMDERRLRLAMETLGMSNSMANTPSIFNTLSNLQAQANASAQQGRQSNAQFWNQMGAWMAQNWGGKG